MTFWSGSGSAYPCLWLMDPDPAFFFKKPTKNYFCLNIFSAYYCLKVHLHNLPKIKSQKESQNSRNQGFSYYFCMMTEGSGSGSIPLTNSSGSGRPKNMWIRWIRIRIRIRNTGCNMEHNIRYSHLRIRTVVHDSLLKLNLQICSKKCEVCTGCRPPPPFLY